MFDRDSVEDFERCRVPDIMPHGGQSWDDMTAVQRRERLHARVMWAAADAGMDVYTRPIAPSKPKSYTGYWFAHRGTTDLRYAGYDPFSLLWQLDGNRWGLPQ